MEDMNRLEPQASTQCEATLRHAHGVSGCWLRGDHDGKHKTLCESCEESGDYDTWLSWEGNGRTEWAI